MTQSLGGSSPAVAPAAVAPAVALAVAFALGGGIGAAGGGGASSDDHGAHVHTMHRGEGFGEWSLLSKQPRSATIITASRTELIVISKAQYDLIIDDGVVLSPALSISILQQDPEKRDDKLARFLTNFIRHLRFFRRFETKALEAALPGVRYLSVEAGRSMFEEGDKVPQSYPKAFAAFRRAAAEGHAEAQYRLGLFYQEGLGTTERERNPRKAVQCFQRAAHQGLAEAQHHMGLLYYHGQYVPRDLVRARGE